MSIPPVDGTTVFHFIAGEPQCIAQSGDSHCQYEAPVEMLGPFRRARIGCGFCSLCVNQSSPSLREVAPAPRIALFEKFNSRDTIGPERSKILSKLAPPRDEASGLDKAEHDWPDDPLGLVAFRIVIGDVQFELFAHRLAQDLKIHRGRCGRSTTNVEGIVGQHVPEFRGEYRPDLGDRVLCGERQAIISLAADPLRP